MSKVLELLPEQLRYHCDENMFTFETTESVPTLEVMIGQERAVKAVEFGLFTKTSGYNIFISGLMVTSWVSIPMKETIIVLLVGEMFVSVN